jgi:RHS repeat-associated protein
LTTQYRYALANRLIAVTAVHVIHSDHLNTPRALANAQTQGGQAAGTVVWRWKLNQQTATGSNAFGAQPAEEDPDGNGISLRFDLRFPGQQYDAATGLHYNYFRDYEPGTGRYVESDPIGLGGGLNTFAYGASSPLRFDDPSGLFYDQAGRYLVECAKPVVAISTVVASGVVMLLTPNTTSACDTIDKPPECKEDCEALYRQIHGVLNELKKRYRDMREDRQDLFNTRPTGINSWAGHQQQFRNRQATLRYLLNQATRVRHFPLLRPAPNARRPLSHQ